MIRLKLYENVEYTPEMLDKFVEEGRSIVSKLTEVTKKFKNKALNITVGEVVDDPTTIQKLIEKLDEAISFAKNKYEQYYDIADMFEFKKDEPRADSVNDIENNATNIDYLVMDLQAIKDVLDNLQDGAKYMRRLSVKDED